MPLLLSAAAPNAVNLSSLVGCCSPGFSCTATVYISFSKVHIKIIRDHVQTKQGHDCSLFIYFLRCYVISSLQWIPLSEFFCFLFPAQDFSLCLEMSLVFMVVLLILSELRGASFSFIHFLVVLLFKRTSQNHLILCNSCPPCSHEYFSKLF